MHNVRSMDTMPDNPTNRRQTVDIADAKDVAIPGFRRYLCGAAIAVVGLGLTILTGCGSKAPANVPGADAKAAALDVVVCNPKRETVTRLIEQPGFIKAFYETPIYSKIAGFALTPEYDIGDHVKEGTRLLRYTFRKWRPI